jgi:hypothetical protein
VRARDQRDAPRTEAPDERARALVLRLADVRDPERDIRAELLERALEDRELPAYERVVADARRPALHCTPSAAGTSQREGRGDVRRRATRLRRSASSRASYATCARALAVRSACRASAPSSALRCFTISYISCCAHPHRPIHVRMRARGTHTREEPARDEVLQLREHLVRASLNQRTAKYMAHAEPAPTGSGRASCRRVRGERNEISRRLPFAKSRRLCFTRRTVTLPSSVPRGGSLGLFVGF